MKEKRQKNFYTIPIILFSLLLISLLPTVKANAAAASTVTIGTIDYEELTIQIFNNDNTMVYYSIDDTNWIEVEAAYSSTTKSYLMDISWVSETSDVTLYFKGDIATKVNSVMIPERNNSFKVTYDKVEGEFIFSEAEEADFFEWRKATDYTWNKVSFNETYVSYKSFMETVAALNTKGARVIFRTPQVLGSASNAGSRPSKEVTVTIPARAEAPSVVVYSSKLTLNTTTALEYYDAVTGLWIECDRTMPLADIAPKVLYKNGGQDVTIMIRRAATTSASYSKTAVLTIKGQAMAPEIGDNSKDVTYYYANSKLVMAFNNATTKNLYEYSIVKPGSVFDVATARWSSVSSNRLMTISNSAAPSGSTVYVRKKGIDASASRNIELVLSSAISSFQVNY